MAHVSLFFDESDFRNIRNDFEMTRKPVKFISNSVVLWKINFVPLSKN